jgi:hypothetical protein
MLRISVRWVVPRRTTTPVEACAGYPRHQLYPGSGGLKRSRAGAIPRGERDSDLRADSVLTAADSKLPLDRSRGLSSNRELA